MKKAVIALALLLTACAGEGQRRHKEALFVGIDVSGSFYKGGHYQDALDFLAHYLHGRINGIGNLASLKGLFVGTVGGEFENEAKAFRPIHDFQEKSVKQIHADLVNWFPKSDRNTDFNTFFRQVAVIAQKRNLALTPITILILSDGLPDLPGLPKTDDKFAAIDLEPIEFLSRKVTVRLLYASAVSSNKWETVIARKRVRMWTVDQKVMEGWRAQLMPDLPMAEQEKFWTWVRDNIDFRVRPVKFARRK